MSDTEKYKIHHKLRYFLLMKAWYIHRMTKSNMIIYIGNIKGKKHTIKNRISDKES